MLQFSLSYSSFSICRSSYFKSLAMQVRLQNDATSFFLRVYKHRLHFQQCLWSCSVHLEVSVKTPQNTKKLDTTRWKDPRVVFDRIDKIHLFIHSFICYGHWTKLAARTFYEETRCIVPCRFRTVEENSRQKKHLHNVVSQFLAPFFSCKFSD